MKFNLKNRPKEPILHFKERYIADTEKWFEEFEKELRQRYHKFALFLSQKGENRMIKEILGEA